MNITETNERMKKITTLFEMIQEGYQEFEHQVLTDENQHYHITGRATVDVLLKELNKQAVKLRREMYEVTT